MKTLIFPQSSLGGPPQGPCRVPAGSLQGPRMGPCGVTQGPRGALAGHPVGSLQGPRGGPRRALAVPVVPRGFVWSPFVPVGFP